MRATLLCLCLLAPSVFAANAYPQGKLPDAATPEAYRIDLTVVRGPAPAQ